MKRSTIIFLSIAIFLFVSFLFYKYFINIYETIVKVEPEKLFADSQSSIVVSVIPLNALGWKALFRYSTAEFEIIEGNSLAEIQFTDSVHGKLILKAKSETGKIVVRIKSEYSFFPMIVEIPVYPNFT
jgi:hypothetical protein